MKTLTKEEFESTCERLGEEGVALKADGFDDCCVGTCSRFNQPEILAYSISAVIERLMEPEEVTSLDAWEFFEYNIIGVWVGEGTPCFIEDTP
jgi:hypothetical protein